MLSARLNNFPAQVEVDVLACWFRTDAPALGLYDKIVVGAAIFRYKVNGTHVLTSRLLLPKRDGHEADFPCVFETATYLVVKLTHMTPPSSTLLPGKCCGNQAWPVRNS